MKLFALVLFILTYILMIALPKYRPWTAAVCAVIFLAVGVVPLRRLPTVINFNVLLMLAGTMGTVSLFIESYMPMRMAEALLRRVPNVKWLIIAMSLFAGVISAFVDNVATVLMIAPIGIAIAKKLDISPVGMVIAIAVSANLQGAATLVGDTTSIMLAGYADMTFVEFFVVEGRPSIFFAVELGALVTVPVMLVLFRKQRGKVTTDDRTEVTDYVPTVLLAGTVLALILVSFWNARPSITNGVICAAFFAAGLLCRGLRDGNASGAAQAVKEIDYRTLILLAALFVMIDALTEVGVIDDISRLFISVGGEHKLLVYTLIVWISVAFSAFVDNIPYVATMLPVVAKIASSIGCSPYLLFFGLLTGATLGGNLTPFGASANIAGIGILQKCGADVKSRDFFKISIPFTLCAVIAGYLFVWFVWGMV